MWDLVVYGLAVYGAVSMLVNFSLSSLWRNKSSRHIHLIVLLQDSEQNVEWVYHSLHKLSMNTGRSISITFIDSGSQDDTLLILTKLARQAMHVSIMKQHEAVEVMVERIVKEFNQSSPTVLIDLRKRYGT